MLIPVRFRICGCILTYDNLIHCTSIYYFRVFVSILSSMSVGTSAAVLPVNSRISMSSSVGSDRHERSKVVWVWTESRQVMTAAVERGWNTFIFGSEPRSKELAHEWSCKLVRKRGDWVFVPVLIFHPFNFNFLTSCFAC